VTDLQIYLTLGIFATVILVIALDVLDMTVSALIGVCALLAFGLLDTAGITKAMRVAGGPLSLLFGGMVVARMLGRTGVFARIGEIYLHACAGSGRRFLLLLIALVAPVCALLPNATTVVLLAPIIVSVARALKVDFVAPLILTAVVSNAAGLLTLVGDPATFLVGNAIGMSFGEYLRMVSPAGLLTVLVIVPLLPLLMPQVWRSRTEVTERLRSRISNPAFALFALVVLALMVGLFLLGEALPVPLPAPEVAIVGATLALLVVYQFQVEPVEEVLRAVDWKTLIFIGASFCLVQAITETGLLQSLALKLQDWFGEDFTLVALALLATIGVMSSVLANTPVVAAALVTTKAYLVAVQAVPEVALADNYTAWPGLALPLFVGMMFGGTLGGNATLIGASANMVSAGICAAEGERITFMRFMRIGLPIALAQLLVGALYVVLVLPRLVR
jgi:Na+/H+ antiporter NhaD/arsenite permease-like protein